MVAPLAIIFALGIVNFALHRGVLESGHRLLDLMPRGLRANGGRLTLVIEFAILLAAMALAANGWPGAALAYGGYTALNLVSAWLIFSGRI